MSWVLERYRTMTIRYDKLGILKYDTYRYITQLLTGDFLSKSNLICVSFKFKILIVTHTDSGAN